MENRKFKLLLYAGGAILIPYIYLFTIRPKLLQMENSFDSKITSISDKDLENMKKKLEQMRNKRKEE